MASPKLLQVSRLVSLKDFRPCVAYTCRGSQARAAQRKISHNHIHALRLLCRAASSEAIKSDDYAAALMQVYERETPVITALLEEIEEHGLVYDSVDKLTGKPVSEAEKRSAVRKAVENHFQDFSEAVIMVLAGYAQASYQEGHHKVAETLEMIREEVLAKSLSQLPPEMQALEHLIGIFDQSSEERVRVAKELAKTGYAGIAQADLAALRTTASQMLEDMEEKQSIVNSQLLAKLCIVREEIDMAASELGLLVEDSPYYELMSATWRLLPMGPAAFVKELLHVSVPEKRRALLAACIKHDFQSGFGGHSLQRWVEEGVRPGRLLNTLAALLSGLKHEGLRPDNKEVLRLREIKAEALNLLYDVAETELEDE